MPLACLPVPIAGRNRLWRDLVMDSIRTDPQWLQGEYRSEPMQALHAAAGFMLIAGSAPIQMQIALPTRDAADEFLKVYMDREIAELDANDLCIRSTRRATTTPPAVSTRSRRASCGSIRPTISSIRRISASRSARSRNQERALHPVAGLRADARARHAQLGCGVAAISERAARLDPAEIGG
jgi:hypothetical protein